MISGPLYILVALLAAASAWFEWKLAQRSALSRALSVIACVVFAACAVLAWPYPATWLQYLFIIIALMNAASSYMRWRNETNVR